MQSNWWALSRSVWALFTFVSRFLILKLISWKDCILICLCTWTRQILSLGQDMIPPVILLILDVATSTSETWRSNSWARIKILHAGVNHFIMKTVSMSNIEVLGYLL